MNLITHHIKRIGLIAALTVPIVAFIFATYFLVSSRASANIRIDAGAPIGSLRFAWKAIAQGGEEAGARMLSEQTNIRLSELSPRYIRIDHIYDFYHVVSGDKQSGYTYDWTRLDETVCDIYTTGAKPFFSLGYMPPSMSRDGSLIDQPIDYADWGALVRATIERYSGQNTVLCGGSVSGDSLAHVYYEVWNEPDLESFGSWKTYGGKNYLALYEASARAAQSANSIREFKLGGPATTAPYRNWMQAVVTFASERDLRLDFLSWHRYSTNPQQFEKDVREVDSWLTKDAYPAYYNIPRIVSEWGIDSESVDVYNTKVAAAHTVATTRHLLDTSVDLAFSFEARDGQSSKFGILTYNGDRKPRYDALSLLNLVDGQYRLAVDGETDHIKVIAASNPQGNNLTMIVANYDERNIHDESVPITIGGLPDGSYRMAITNLGLGRLELAPFVVVDGQDVKRSIYMLPNHVAAIEIEPLEENGQ